MSTKNLTPDEIMLALDEANVDAHPGPTVMDQRDYDVTVALTAIAAFCKKNGIEMDAA